MQDKFAGGAGEGKGGEEETTGGYFYSSGKKFFRFLAPNFYHKTLTCTCILETDVCVYKQNLDLDMIRGARPNIQYFIADIA